MSSQLSVWLQLWVIPRGFVFQAAFTRCHSLTTTLICRITTFEFLAKREKNGTESQNNVQKNYSWQRCDNKQGVQLKVVIKLTIQSLHLKKNRIFKQTHSQVH